jgi:hypothetical protein
VGPIFGCSYFLYILNIEAVIATVIRSLWWVVLLLLVRIVTFNKV